MWGNVTAWYGAYGHGCEMTHTHTHGYMFEWWDMSAIHKCVNPCISYYWKS